MYNKLFKERNPPRFKKITFLALFLPGHQCFTNKSCCFQTLVESGQGKDKLLTQIQRDGLDPLSEIARLRELLTTLRAELQCKDGKRRIYRYKFYEEHLYLGIPNASAQMDGQTDAGQSDPYVPLCFAGDTKKKQGKDIPNLYIYAPPL